MTNVFSFGNASPRKKPGPEGGCGCLAFALFFFAGLVFFTLMIGTVVWPEWRANHSYVPHSCVVLDKRVAESRDSDGSTYRPEIQIWYVVQGKVFRIWTYDAAAAYSSGRSGKQEIIDQFVVGGQYPCWYDPDNPGKAVLVQGYSWLIFLLMLLPLLVVGIGGAGMYYCWNRLGKSPEELAAASAVQAVDGEITQFPAVPDKDLSGKPGDTLKYRLPISTSPGCMLLGVIGLALFWNGITSIFVTFAVRSHLEGRPEWFLTIFILPFVAIGLALIGWCIRQLFITIHFSTAQVEIDAFPLVVGRNTRVQVSQPGPLRLKSLELLLVCEESASYTQGTDTRTETKRVYQHTLAQETDLAVGRDMPWQFRGKLEMPRGAMHSFEARHKKSCGNCFSRARWRCGPTSSGNIRWSCGRPLWGE